MSHIRRDLFPVDPFCEDPTLQSTPAPRPPLHRRIVAILVLWRERTRARRALGQIDARSLRDVGVAPAQAQFEANQPFWRRPGPLR